MIPGFRQYSIYGHTKTELRAAFEVLVSVYDFDPLSISLSRAYKSPKERVGRFLRRLLLVSAPEDWHAFITGPADNRTRAQLENLLAHHRAYTDGGGYDFSYNPWDHYPAHLVEKYEAICAREQAEAEERLRAQMSPQEREEFDAMVRVLEAAQQGIDWED